MFITLRLLTLADDRLDDRHALIERLRSAVVSLPGQQESWITEVAPRPVLNAGHVVWRSVFESEADALAAPWTAQWRQDVAPLLEGVATVTLNYRVTRTGVGNSGPGIWRALIFRTLPGARRQDVLDLESNLLLFPKHISTIRSWALSTISEVEGGRGFTHIWEQEFDSVEGFTGEYMDHPLHWGVVDSYFDAELPQYIVDPYVMQPVAHIEKSIMRPLERS